MKCESEALMTEIVFACFAVRNFPRLIVWAIRRECVIKSRCAIVLNMRDDVNIKYWFNCGP